LFANGISKEQIVLLEADSGNDIEIIFSFDLIISLFSWGFHYPIHTYLNQIYSLLNDGGHLILDVRKGVGGEQDLENKFNNLKIISETYRSLRLLALK
jgi:SAM-dependent methyltransferase